MLQGSINHVSVAVSDLGEAMGFFGPILQFLGYSVGEAISDESSGARLCVNINQGNGIAFNVWEARPGLARHPFEVYEPGLHHVAFNAGTHAQVDEMHELVKRLGGKILDGPGEFPFGPGGYYAVYFLGPDNLKFEFVHMPLLERRFRELGVE